jgi:hypothetical protein
MIFRLIIFFAFVLLSCDPSYLDNGFMEVDGRRMEPLDLPYVVAHDDSISGSAIDEAVAWWHEETDLEVGSLFVVDHDPELFDELDGLSENDRIGAITVWSEWPNVPEDVEALGATIIRRDSEARIKTTEVLVSPDVIGDRQWTIAVLRHEFGHCLGLAHDPNSIDLNSIMSSSVNPIQGLTPGDRERIRSLALPEPET